MVDSTVLEHEVRCGECKKIQDKDKAKPCFLRFCPYLNSTAFATAQGEAGESMFPEEKKKAG
jgi:hypothetical protein